MPDHPESKLKILSIGAGAVGTYVGGSLALQGHSLVYLEQTAAAEKLQVDGVRLKLGEEEHHLTAVLSTASIPDALAQGPLDLAIFALKSFDTQSALQALRLYREQIPPVLCLQNGVDNETALEAAFGKDRVIAGTLTSAIGRLGVGHVVCERLRGMGVATGHPLSAKLVQALNDAGLNARLYARAADMKWSKLLTNLLANASSAILNMTPSEIFAHPGLFNLETTQLREALKVMDAYHFRVVDLPGTPVRALALSLRTLPGSVIRPIMKKAVGSGRGAKMPSFHIDLHSGRGISEVDYLNGAIVRYGQQAGVSVPVNRLLNETLLALIEGRANMADYDHQPDKLLASIEPKA